MSMYATRDVAVLSTLAAAVFAVVLVAYQALTGDGTVQPLVVLVGALVFWAAFFGAYRFVRQGP